MKDLTDKELLDLIKQSNHTAFCTLFKRFQPFLLNAGNKMLSQDKEIIRDLINDIFATLWERRETIHITHEIGAVLYVSLKRKIYDIYKHTKVIDRYHTIEYNGITYGGDSSDHLIRYKQLNEYIQQEIKKLSPTVRTVMELKILSMMSRTEISDKLNMPMPTVKTNIHRGLSILKKALKPFQN